MEILSITKKKYRFVDVSMDYLTKFTEVRSLDTFVEKEVGRFVYERIINHFGVHLEMVSDNKPHFAVTCGKI